MYLTGLPARLRCSAGLVAAPQPRLPLLLLHSHALGSRKVGALERLALSSCLFFQSLLLLTRTHARTHARTHTHTNNTHTHTQTYTQTNTRAHTKGGQRPDVVSVGSESLARKAFLRSHGPQLNHELACVCMRACVGACMCLCMCAPRECVCLSVYRLFCLTHMDTRTHTFDVFWAQSE